jgi:hypothetical protein
MTLQRQAAALASGEVHQLCWQRLDLGADNSTLASASRPGSGQQRPNRRAALVEQLGMDTLLPGAALIHQGALQPAQGADLQHVRRRDPRLRKPALHQERAQQPRIGPIDLGALLRTPQTCGLGGSPRCATAPVAALTARQRRDSTRCTHTDKHTDRFYMWSKRLWR